MTLNPFKPAAPCDTRATVHRPWRGVWLVATLLMTVPAMSQTAPSKSKPANAAKAADATDPFLWLEDVQGERAMEWVLERNRASEAVLTADTGFEERRRLIREVLDSRDQIPYVARQGDWLYNLWRDAANPRGLWRRTTLAEYRKAQPAWETVLDVDALAASEKENWVWSGAQCLGPSYRYCLLSLSRGGADATVVSEFDTVSKTFIVGGFAVPEAKTSIEWVDEDTVLIGSNFGPGSLTDSGYPRLIKRWKRSQALSEAVTVFEAKSKDVAAFASVDHTPGFERTVVGRSEGFYTSEQFLLRGDERVRIDKPADAQLAFWRERVLVTLRSPWRTGGKTWPKGSLLVADADAYLKGKRNFTALFTPSPTRSLEGYTVTRSTVILNVLDNVASKLEEWRPGADQTWQMRAVKAPYPGQLSATALHDPQLKDDPLAENYLLNSADFLQPDALMLGRSGSDEREGLKSRPTFFDAAGMRVEQRFAKSKDGTRVPYFVVWPKGATADGRNPTLLYGYGGFEVSMGPWYSGSMGRVWASQGGVFVVANIRGGGEFGPSWHQAGILKNKQKSYDDFAAVAQDLITTKVTNAAHLGIQGGSNGGLLVGAVMLQRPELFNAVVCQVPLLDMQRYHKLLAGASWMAEYGDPDKAADWAYISRYSPYQNVRAGRKLPKVLFTTSTRDDRVHPGHARKMAARMMEQGHPLLYWENIEGGHGGAADNAQRAQMLALEYNFLWQQLGLR
jgi:prolyl oligopeptidase